MERRTPYRKPQTTWVWVGLDKRVANSTAGNVHITGSPGEYDKNLPGDGGVKGEVDFILEPLPQLKNIWDEAW